MASAFGGLATGLATLALGAIGFELAKAGDLGTGFQTFANNVDKALGGTGGPSKPGGSKCTSGQMSVTCGDGARCKSWADIDSELHGAGWPGTPSHDQAEFDVYVHTCGGPAGQKVGS